MCSDNSLTLALSLRAAIVSPSTVQQLTAVSPAVLTSLTLAPRASSRTLAAYWSCLAAMCLCKKNHFFMLSENLWKFCSEFNSQVTHSGVSPWTLTALTSQPSLSSISVISELPLYALQWRAIFCSASLIKGSHFFSKRNFATSEWQNSQAQIKLVQPPSSTQSGRLIIEKIAFIEPYNWIIFFINDKLKNIIFRNICICSENNVYIYLLKSEVLCTRTK